MISELCEQLLYELKRSKSPILPLLQPGISKMDVDSSLQMADIDLLITNEVYSLYGWRNGIDDDEANSRTLGELSLFKLGIFVSFNLAVASYLEWAVQGSYWAKSLFPLFESGAGDYYLIDTNKESFTYGMILYYSPSNPYFQGVASIFDSLDSCLTCIIECYKEKIYYFNTESPDFKIRDELEMAIWRKHNPRSQYYKILDRFK